MLAEVFIYSQLQIAHEINDAVRRGQNMRLTHNGTGTAVADDFAGCKIVETFY